MTGNAMVMHSTKTTDAAYVPVMPASVPRYAIYFSTPAGHPLTEVADKWLSRGAGRTGFDHRHGAIVSEPGRYGFHATLKAPFRLADGMAIEALETALADFCVATRPCPIGPLRVGLLGGFFALLPVQDIPAVPAFASRIVEAFDRFRAPFNTMELKRRMAHRLNDDETEHLVRWGYPYVFERFRFHMTLTNRVDPEARAGIEAELHRRFDAWLGQDYAIDALCLCEQVQPGGDFALRRRFPLNGKAPL